jgi:hemolysin activation/secretion protein
VHFDLGYEGSRERSAGQDADFSFWGDLDQPNPTVDEGDEHAMVAKFELGGRRWLNARLTQRLAGGSLGGDFRYARTDLMLHARGFILGRQEFETTLQGVTTADAPPFQQLADIGGLSTVRGYERRTHVGEHSFAARVEYMFPYDVFASTKIPLVKDLGVQLIPWGDAARVGDGDSNDWITSAGFGLQRYLWPLSNAANVRLDFAWPQNNPNDDFTVYLWFTALH